MEELIEIVNQLQDIYAGSDCEPIDLPQIVVVGAQSSGKSSVLEHIVGKSFLPRGAGIVTRCPLVLQMVHTPDAQNDYATFNHNQKKIFTDNKSIRKEIEDETDRLAGENKGICNKSINLKMCSPSYTSLTLVDLPGIVKNPVGDQPQDIEDQVRNLILSFIKKPNCLILAVSPANVDLATSDSIKIAAEVDPLGERTLAVLTKLDLMDKGTDAWDMLQGKIIPVKLGIIGVVNRSQQDNQEDKSITESRKDEEKFLETNYHRIASSHGSGYLTKKVQKLLMDHIAECLPYLKNKIKAQLGQKRSALSQYEDNKNIDKESLLLDLLSEFSRTYVSAIKGYLPDIETNELYGGARIKYVFNRFSSTVHSFEALVGITDLHMLTAIKNASGIAPAIYVPEVAFELLVKKQIEIFRQPSLTCLELVFEEMKTIVHTCIESDSGIKRYFKLKEAIDTAMTDILQKLIPKSKDMIGKFIDVQIAHINTDHPAFFPRQEKSFYVIKGDNGQPRMTLVDLPSGKLTPDKTTFDLQLVQTLIKSYFTIVRGMVQDTIPKIIMYGLVNHVMEKLERELSRHLSGQAEDLLVESNSLVEKREALKKEVAGLEKIQRDLYKLSAKLIT